VKNFQIDNESLDVPRFPSFSRSRGISRIRVENSPRVPWFHRMRDIDNRARRSMVSPTDVVSPLKRHLTERHLGHASERSGAEAEAHARARDAIVPCVGCQFISRTSTLDATPRRRELFRE